VIELPSVRSRELVAFMMVYCSRAPEDYREDDSQVPPRGDRPRVVISLHM